jgi:hypothetical protein
VDGCSYDYMRGVRGVRVPHPAVASRDRRTLNWNTSLSLFEIETHRETTRGVRTPRTPSRRHPRQHPGGDVRADTLRVPDTDTDRDRMGVLGGRRWWVTCWQTTR